MVEVSSKMQGDPGTQGITREENLGPANIMQKWHLYLAPFPGRHVVGDQMRGPPPPPQATRAGWAKPTLPPL